MKHTIVLLIANMYIFSALSAPEQAVFVVPVADLIGQPITSIEPHASTLTQYHNLPICGKSGTYACPRLMQGLFNERVTLLQIRGEEAQISLSHLFFLTPPSTKSHTSYWTLKKNVVPIKALKNTIDITSIPPAISYKNNHSIKHAQTITLIEPWHSKKTNQTYSVGTRFMLAQTPSNESENYQIKLFDPQQKTSLKTAIPKGKAIHTHKMPKQEKINLMVSIVRKWANQKKGCIPYVWGGCSHRATYADNKYTIKEKKYAGEKVSYIHRPDTKHYPIDGFDCAGLVARAAQLAGIPYFYKNTTTLAQKLRPLAQEEQIENGDLIWIPGHVIIVSDVSNNLIVEARHYSHGYGRVHEIKLNQEFKDMHTYNDLKKAFFNKQPLMRLNKQGDVISTINNFKILKLSTVWPSNTPSQSMNHKYKKPIKKIKKENAKNNS